MEESNVLLTFSGKTLKGLNKMCSFVMSFTSYMANILKTYILDSYKNGNSDYCNQIWDG